MKIIVAGKGGAGKTTVSGTLARVLSRAGEEVIAVDADVNPMLGISLGVGMDETERLAGIRESLQQGHIEHAHDVEALVATFGTTAPDGVQLVVGSRMDGPDSGCACCGVNPDQLLNELDGEGRVVIGDLEAGIGIVTRMDTGNIDLVLVVTNATSKSIEVARRAADSAAGRGAEVLVIANRIGTDDDLEEIRAALGEHEIIVVPEDDAIRRADEEGLAPLDGPRDGPGMVALLGLGERLALRAAA
ncbi:MAG: AAA family ATPase [Solirubrobacterales bacterium]|nr:AAA family ATPase [Solirubrobacterales bacterium]